MFEPSSFIVSSQLRRLSKTKQNKKIECVNCVSNTLSFINQNVYLSALLYNGWVGETTSFFFFIPFCQARFRAIIAIKEQHASCIFVLHADYWLQADYVCDLVSFSNRRIHTIPTAINQLSSPPRECHRTIVSVSEANQSSSWLIGVRALRANITSKHLCAML